MKRSLRFVWEGREFLSLVLVEYVFFLLNILVYLCSYGDFFEFSIEKLIIKFYFIYNIYVYFVVICVELLIYYLLD